MKKKLALLLAAVMLITAALPMNLLAATSNNKLSAVSSTFRHGSRTIMVDDTVRGTSNTLAQTYTTGLFTWNNIYNRLGTWAADNYGTSAGNNSQLANDGRGVNLEFNFTDPYTIPAGTTFTVEYENAIHAFYAANSSFWSGTYTPAAHNEGYYATFGDYLTSTQRGVVSSLNTTGNAVDRLYSNGSTTNDQLAMAPDSGTPDNYLTTVINAGINAINATLTGLNETNAKTTNVTALWSSYLTATSSSINNWPIDYSDTSMTPAQAIAKNVAEKAIFTAAAEDYFANAFNDGLIAAGISKAVDYYKTTSETFEDLFGMKIGVAGTGYPFAHVTVITDLKNFANSDSYNALNATAATTPASATQGQTFTFASAWANAYNAAATNAYLEAESGNTYTSTTWNTVSDVTTLAIANMYGYWANNPSATAAPTGYNIDLSTVTTTGNSVVAANTAGVPVAINALLDATDDALAVYNAIQANIDALADLVSFRNGFSGYSLTAQDKLDLLEANRTLAQKDTAKAFVSSTAGSGNGTQTANGTYQPGTYLWNIDAYARLSGVSVSSSTAKAVPYRIDVNSDMTTATITLQDDANYGDVLVFPMVLMSLSTDPVRVRAYGPAISDLNWTTISTSTATYGRTTNSFLDVVDAARGRIYLGDLQIAENNPNVIVDGGAVVLIPPTGYDMVRVEGSNGSTGPTLYNTTGGLRGATLGNITEFTVVSKSNTSENPRRAIGFTISTTACDRNYSGSLVISGLALAPHTNDVELVTNIGDTLKVDIRNYHSNTSGTGFFDLYNPIARISTASTLLWWNTNGVAAAASNITAWNAANEAPVVVSANVYPGTIDAAIRQEWNLGYTAATAVEAFSGKNDIVTAKVTISEKSLDSWNARKETIFTVTDAEGNTLDDVKITRVRVATYGLSNVYAETGYFAGSIASGGYTDYWNRDSAGAKTGSPQVYSNINFSRDGHEFHVHDLYTWDRDYAKMELTFYLSADPNFDSDVYITASGAAIEETGRTNVENAGTVMVATFAPPILISTESTEVQMGYQKYDVAPIVITENFDAFSKSSITTGQKMQIALGEYGNGRLTDYIYFAPVSKSDVSLGSDPNFSISEVSTVDLINNGYRQRAIEFTVMRKSTTVGGEITLTNLSVNIGRDTPQGDYDLIVGGSAIVNNNLPANSTYLYMYDLFESFGVIEPSYIKMMTEPSNVQTQNTVTLKSGTNIIQVNGKDEEIPVPVLNVDGRMYVPIRFAAVALNVPDSNIIFDEGSRKVVITTAERIVTFQQDSPVYTINGVELSMNEGGVEAVTFIDPQTDRAYIPVRFLAYALNVSVDYDPETGEAILNAK